jgi:hypothetical protein
MKMNSNLVKFISAILFGILGMIITVFLLFSGMEYFGNRDGQSIIFLGLMDILTFTIAGLFVVLVYMFVHSVRKIDVWVLLIMQLPTIFIASLRGDILAEISVGTLSGYIMAAANIYCYIFYFIAYIFVINIINLKELVRHNNHA